MPTQHRAQKRKNVIIKISTSQYVKIIETVETANRFVSGSKKRKEKKIKKKRKK